MDELQTFCSYNGHNSWNAHPIPAVEHVFWMVLYAKAWVLTPWNSRRRGLMVKLVWAPCCIRGKTGKTGNWIFHISAPFPCPLIRLQASKTDKSLSPFLFLNRYAINFRFCIWQFNNNPHSVEMKPNYKIISVRAVYVQALLQMYTCL